MFFKNSVMSVNALAASIMACIGWILPFVQISKLIRSFGAFDKSLFSIAKFTLETGAKTASIGK